MNVVERSRWNNMACPRVSYTEARRYRSSTVCLPCPANGSDWRARRSDGGETPSKVRNTDGQDGRFHKRLDSLESTRESSVDGLLPDAGSRHAELLDRTR